MTRPKAVATALFVLLAALLVVGLRGSAADDATDPSSDRVRAGAEAGELSAGSSASVPSIEALSEQEQLRRSVLAAGVPHEHGPQSLTAEHRRELSATLSRSHDDLEIETDADGTRSIKLQGRFQHATVAVTGADGSPDHHCLSEAPDSAEADGKE